MGLRDGTGDPSCLGNHYLVPLPAPAPMTARTASTRIDNHVRAAPSHPASHYAIINFQARPVCGGGRAVELANFGPGEDMVAVGATHLRLLAVTAAACMVVMTVSCSSAGTKPTAPGSETPPKPKPEFAQVTSSMFVDRSAVPNSAAMEFRAPSIGSYQPGSGDPVDPPECAPLYWGPNGTQAGSVSWSTMRSAGTNNEGKVFNLFLAVPTERPDFNSLLGKCGTIEYRGVTTTVSPLPLPGLPSWSTAYRITVGGVDGAGIMGLCRGLYVSVVFNQKPGGDLSPNDTNALVKLFNDQVAKLEAI